MNKSLERYAQALQERVEQDALRRLRPSRSLPFGQIELGGKRLVNFATNDYLGLSQHQLVIKRAREFAEQYGAGNCSSRLLSGNLSVFEKIEAKLARLKGCESALILSSGFQTNSSVIPALLDKTSAAGADKLVHRSIIEGLRLSSSRWFRFEHNNLDDMVERLPRFQLQEGPRWLITESVFSADGDRADLERILELSAKHDLAVYVDEAHATGLFGNNGMGLTSGLSIPGVVMGTFGKAVGSFGAYVCCPTVVRDYLINFCPGIIYSTALPPAVLGAIDAALDLIPEMDAERRNLQENADTLRESLRQMGFNTGNSSTQIIPILIGASSSALSLSAYLEEAGFFVPAIRPPTVPEGTARLRLSLSTVHSKDQIDSFLNVLRKWHEKKK